MSRTHKVTATIFDSDDNSIAITGHYYAGCPGQRDSFGAPMTPDDEPTMSIIDAVDSEGESIELTEEQTERALDALHDTLAA